MTVSKPAPLSADSIAMPSAGTGAIVDAGDQWQCVDVAGQGAQLIQMRSGSSSPVGGRGFGPAVQSRQAKGSAGSRRCGVELPSCLGGWPGRRRRSRGRRRRASQAGAARMGRRDRRRWPRSEPRRVPRRQAPHRSARRPRGTSSPAVSRGDASSPARCRAPQQAVRRRGYRHCGVAGVPGWDLGRVIANDRRRSRRGPLRRA